MLILTVSWKFSEKKAYLTCLLEETYHICNFFLELDSFISNDMLVSLSSPIKKDANEEIKEEDQSQVKMQSILELL